METGFLQLHNPSSWRYLYKYTGQNKNIKKAYSIYMLILTTAHHGGEDDVMNSSENNWRGVTNTSTSLHKHYTNSRQHSLIKNNVLPLKFCPGLAYNITCSMQGKCCSFKILEKLREPCVDEKKIVSRLGIMWPWWVRCNLTPQWLSNQLFIQLSKHSTQCQ